MDTWGSNMDLSNIKPTLKHIDKPKNSYNSYNLKSICCKSLTSLYSEYHCVYTDGSRRDNFYGAAFFDSQLGISFKLRILLKLSIMHLEFIAIAEALSYI